MESLTKDDGHGDLGQPDILLMKIAASALGHSVQLKAKVVFYS
jgi:hypothetical protein